MSVAVVLSMEKRGQKRQFSLLMGPKKAISHFADIKCSPRETEEARSESGAKDAHRIARSLIPRCRRRRTRGPSSQDRKVG